MKVAFQVILRNGESNALQGCSCILCPAIWHKKIDVSDNTQALRRIKALDEIRHALQQHRLDINCVQGSYNARKSVEDAFVSRVVETQDGVEITANVRRNCSILQAPRESRGNIMMAAAFD